MKDSTEITRIAADLARLRDIRDNDPEGLLRRAAEAARSHDDALVQAFAPVFEQWALVARFGNQILRIGGPETIAVARKLLGEEA
ncbi:hypothetical protein [Nocardiopsis dassonvillei]|uniref:hypothetical protein n=1 Tax=Nocardiopsis dassonvillei TaxID=2014 RepID=UPI00157DC7BD|nr:hypothetical protein [Nocardiopsis dassonvillei]